MSWFRRSKKQELPQGGGGGSHHSANNSNDSKTPPRDDDDVVLSPDRPPPIKNVLHSPAGPGAPPISAMMPPPLSPSNNNNKNKRSSLDHLTKQRPIDPVFRSETAYATYPKMAMPAVGTAPDGTHASPAIHVFDPSAGKKTEKEEVEKVVVEEIAPNNNNNDYTDDADEAAVKEPAVEDTFQEEQQQHQVYEDHTPADLMSQEDESKFGIGYHLEPPLDGSAFHQEQEGAVHLNEAVEGTEPTLYEDESSPTDSVEPEEEVAETDDEIGEQEDEQPTSIVVAHSSANEKSTVDNPIGDAHHLPAILETPTRPPKHSRFVFLSDQKSVPTDMKKLQERTIKRRRDLLAKMHDADCHMASLVAKFAEEKMDMELAVSDTFERSVAHPLSSSIERLSIQREAYSNMHGVSDLEKRVNHMDASMAHHLNVTLGDIKRDQLENLHGDVQKDIMTEIRVETSTGDKVEGGIVRRFETVVGEIAKDFHGEGAARRADIEIMKKKTDREITDQSERLENALSRIANLRAQLRQERADRRAADQVILESIVTNQAAMKRAMMALVSDGELG